MMSDTLGLVETRGMLGAVEALDVCMKSAIVHSKGVELISGGLVVAKVTGDVAAVSAAIDAAASAVTRLGCLISTHVIPRPSAEVIKMISCTLNTNADLLIKDYRAGAAKEDSNKGNSSVVAQYSMEELNLMKVVELRKIARGIEEIQMTREEIKFGRKEELVEAILISLKKGNGEE